MHRFSTIYKLAVLALLVIVIGCGKREAPDFNNQIITKPYSLYVVDSFGEVLVTNDGEVFKSIFDPSGEPGRAIATSGENVIWAQRTNGFHAKDSKDLDKLQFNLIREDISALAFNQSMILDVPDYSRVYMAGNQGRGIIYSDSAGKPGTWRVDNGFNPVIDGSIIITSFTQTDDGKIWAYDFLNNRLFYKTGANVLWEEKPHDLPTGGKFFISHIQNTLVAGDSTGVNGVYFSNNMGANWTAYTGIPAGAKILCMQPAFKQTLLVGTATDGLFRLPLNSTQFEQSNQGLDANASIRGLAAK